MKKLALVVLLLLVAGPAAWYFSKSDSGTGEPADNRLLAFVPADTIFFSGSLEPVSIEQNILMMQQYGMFSSADLMLESGLEVEETAPDGVKLLTALYGEYMGALTDPRMLTQHFGIADPLNAAVYGVGTLPVMRVALADPEVFIGLLDGIEDKHDINPDRSAIQGVSFRAYRLSDEAEAESYRLVVAQHDGYAVLTLDTPLADSVDLAPALGAVKPDSSLADTETLPALVKKYDFLASSLTYIDHVSIAKGITRPESNGFGQMLSALINHHDSDNPFASVQNDACHGDLTQLAGHWPRLVAGNTRIDDEGMEGSLILEGRNPELLQDLAKIRGHIPGAILGDDFAISLGLGLDMDAIAPYLTRTWRKFTQATYQCEPLIAMQASAKESNPAMLGAMTGMMAGVKGIAAGLINLQMEDAGPGAAPEVTAADMMVTITAEDPQALLSVMAMMQPGLAELAIEDGGEPVSLPMPLAPELDIKAAQRGHNLILFVGPESAAHLAAFATKTDPEANGLMAFSMNAGKYFGMLADLVNAMPYGSIDDEDRRLLERMQDMKGIYNSSLDVTDDGVVNTMDVQMAE